MTDIHTDFDFDFSMDPDAGDGSDGPAENDRARAAKDGPDLGTRSKRAGPAGELRFAADDSAQPPSSGESAGGEPANGGAARTTSGDGGDRVPENLLDFDDLELGPIDSEKAGPNGNGSAATAPGGPVTPRRGRSRRRDADSAERSRLADPEESPRKRRRPRPAGSDDDGSFLPPEPGSGGGDDAASGPSAEAPGGEALAPPDPEPAKREPPVPRAPVTPDEDWLGEAEEAVGGGDFEGLGRSEQSPVDSRTSRELARESRQRAVRGEGGSAEQPVPIEALVERRRSRLPEPAARVLHELRHRAASLPIPLVGGRGGRGGGNDRPGRVKKARFAIIAIGLSGLAMASMVFGMMMAVAQDVDGLDIESSLGAARNSVLYDAQGQKIGTLYNNNQRIFIESSDISPYIKEAVVAIEDERFYEHRGVDYKGMARAVVQDILPGGSIQGASTITQQFVKNQLEAQDSRTVFQKLRESALAYHLERQWDKDKILTQYLNTIYFGEGAYGVESAARTYFGNDGCGTDGEAMCASTVSPDEAALLAAIITSPSTFSPRVNPDFAIERRNLVLERMRDRGVISQEEYDQAITMAPPAPSEIQRPKDNSEAPHFTQWLRQLLVDRYGATRAFSGGLTVFSSLDLEMQQAAQDAAESYIGGIGPDAAVVVLKNDTAEIKAMVGGLDYDSSQFNAATDGVRQPGSTFKPFILARALQTGISPDQTFASEVKSFPVPGGGKGERFVVHNYEDQYSGTASLTSATTNSDNSVYAELGLSLGTDKVARLASEMGIGTPISTNPAMTLGALKQGVTPLELTHAYLTLQAGGNRLSGQLDSLVGEDPDNPHDDGPVPLKKILRADGEVLAKNATDKKPVISTPVVPEDVADTATDILGTVISSGTGANAAFSDALWGKTGTTEDYGDARFCGASENFTACVWVGYLEGSQNKMTTEYGGSPVAGGTYPALIWARAMAAIEAIQAELEAERESDSSDSDDEATYVVPSSGSSASSGSSDSSGSTGSSGSSGSGSGDGSSAPAPAPAPAPAAPAPSGGGGVGGGSGL